MSVCEKFIKDFLQLKINNDISDADLSAIAYINQLTAEILKQPQQQQQQSPPPYLYHPDSTPADDDNPNHDDTMSLHTSESSDIVPHQIDFDEHKSQVALSFSQHSVNEDISLANLLSNLKTKEGKPWQPSGLDTVRRALEKLSMELFQTDFNINAFIAEPMAVWTFLENHKKRSWLIRHLATIFRENDLKNKEIYAEYHAKTAEHIGYVESTPRPEGWTWNRVLATFESLKNLPKKQKTRTKVKLMLLLAFYVELVPLRQEAFYQLGWIDNEDPENPNDYIDLAAKKMYLRNGKTIATYKPTTYDLKDSLVEIITMWKEDWACHPDLMLAVSRKGPTFLRPISQSAFTGFFKKNLGITSNQIRKLFVSDVVIKSKDLAWRNEIARLMLHSPAMQSLVYPYHQ